jgi:cytochrome c oxidase subunit 1
MGIASDVLSVFARKPIFGYHAMAFSMIGIAFLS